MRGMQPWGLGYDDTAIWSIVAFLNKPPGLSAEHHENLVAGATSRRRHEARSRNAPSWKLRVTAPADLGRRRPPRQKLQKQLVTLSHQDF